MFTGIIQAVGTVSSAAGTARRDARGAQSYRLMIDLGDLAHGLVPGASVAVNGVCLTLERLDGTAGAFDVVPETWQRTTLADLRAGSRVHLENALRVGDPLDGHFVQGHVDGVGTVSEIDRSAGQWKLWVRLPDPLLAAVVPKGSIALHGTSLTIIDVAGDRCSVALVPTTLERTIFAQLEPNDRLNVETDILAKLVLARLGHLAPAERTGGVSWDTLRAAGYTP
jgi:riboflavin synthase